VKEGQNTCTFPPTKKKKLSAVRKIGSWFPVSSFRKSFSFSGAGLKCPPKVAKGNDLYFHGSRVTFLSNGNYQENRVSGFWSLFSGRASLLDSLLVGRASVPAQVSQGQRPVFSWFAGDFFSNGNYQENRVFGFWSLFSGRASLLGSLLVGRASVPAQVSQGQRPVFSWFAGDFLVMAIS